MNLQHPERRLHVLCYWGLAWMQAQALPWGSVTSHLQGGEGDPGLQIPSVWIEGETALKVRSYTSTLMEQIFGGHWSSNNYTCLSSAALWGTKVALTV